MSVLEQLQTDVTTAMKAGQKERVGALRLVISELQKDLKEGKGDQLAVLRRERKRRLEAAEQFRAGERPELAEAEEAEAEVISTYLPTELSDEELEKIVADKIVESNAQGPQDIGRVMSVVMPAVGGRADGKRVSTKVKELLV